MAYGNDASKLHHCLADAYRAQLDALRRADAALATGSHTGLNVAACKGLLDRYRPLANSHLGQPPLRVLAHAGLPGFELTAESGDVLPRASELASWAKAQHPPISISPELSKALAVDENGGVPIKAPGVPFFMFSRFEGSAAVDASVFFFLKNGVALLSQPPFDDAQCPYGGVFGSFNSIPLYICENYDYQPGMKASLEVATWHHDHFEPACTVALSYRPWVSRKTLNPSQDNCIGADCQHLRKMALELVKAKVSGNLGLEPLLRGLTPQQRERYHAEQVAAEAEIDPGGSVDAVSVPYVRQGMVYVARIADLTAGWRTYADQSVKFEELEDGKITVKAAFAVGVWKGELEKADVKPTP